MVDALLEGHAQFLRRYVHDERSFLERLAEEKQSPDAIFIGCSDSRVIPELLTTCMPGQLFVVRNIANLIPPHEHPHVSVGAALEYAVGHLHVPHAIVCGHYGCGGVRAVMDSIDASAGASLARWLEEARDAVDATREHAATPDVWWRRAVEENVLVQLERMTTYPVVAKALERGELQLHGWIYDLFSAEIQVYDADRGTFLTASEELSGGLPDATPPRVTP
ncbi:carbonic anhydrase [Chondromyces apiculatus]|uniref:carbonic anhydrase n=1 Tax=Chondromyces apiculatus DSM 436 TaxID=1192034 RepID=A0A017THS7_9BACT|nr:carbonic anhydrase [Chondromyces apiculatus]EYF08447.1 Carbonic anhydrase [Chondromyces apiculatus DSM 436]